MTHPDLSPIRIDLGPQRGYDVVFQPLEEVPERMAAAGLRPGRCLVVTDEHVAAHYRAPLEAALVAAGWSPLTAVLPPGETTKSAEHLHRLYDLALAHGIDRKTPVLALGGGVVGDLAGYVAATLLRGLPFVQLPTTLIAQVDSALGGKTGINHPLGKNLIGAFHQPVFVCADLRTLDTLPEREWTSGLAEVVKHALIADAAFFTFLQDHWHPLLERRPDVVARTVHRAAAIKAAIVSEDEREHGRRALLNFGHTFGHAIEKVTGYGHFTHGEAVALGMRAALHLSHTLHPDFPLDVADALVRRIPVPEGLATYPIEKLLAAMRVDKKVEAGTVHFVVLRRIGAAYVTGTVPPAAVEAAWTFARTMPS
ncbi:3-dehydroquinate synthase [Rhodocaloribacter litoris]|uniref:3-dehydroquinate synthase n=1 Tax=Rhodocaloribacter litoris TaxID=2558931 RepID=UPI00141DECCE|nr:3-dehydroquinate synthase [Rhodocaloribacter litoris]QXD14863.1 3-dehydroquinate synthase [Rhodocaloribacter litoris]